MTNGSLKPRALAMVRTGSKHEKTAPNSIIFPILGFTGRLARWCPRGVSSSSTVKAFYIQHHTKDRPKYIFPLISSSDHSDVTYTAPILQVQQKWGEEKSTLLQLYRIALVRQSSSCYHSPYV